MVQIRYLNWKKKKLLNIEYTLHWCCWIECEYPQVMWNRRYLNWMKKKTRWQTIIETWLFDINHTDRDHRHQTVGVVVVSTLMGPIPIKFRQLVEAPEILMDTVWKQPSMKLNAYLHFIGFTSIGLQPFFFIYRLKLDKLEGKEKSKKKISLFNRNGLIISNEPKKTPIFSAPSTISYCIHNTAPEWPYPSQSKQIEIEFFIF